MIRTIIAAGLLSIGVCSAQPASTGDPPRPAAAILGEYDRIHFPGFSGDASPAGQERFREQIREAARAQVDLAAELHRSYPGHPRVPEVMAARWALLTNSLDRAPEVLDEVEPFLEEDVAVGLRSKALLARARASLVLENVPAARKIRFVEEAVAVAPDDPLCGVYLMDLARYHVADVAEMRRICDLVLERWPDNAWAAAPAKGLRKQLDRVGKPLPLDFEDVVTGRRITDAGLRGRPLVVMLWSGGSTGMERELARVRELLATHARRGLTVIGVHTWRHQDGAAGLKKELAEHGIDWPQRYVEAEMKSPFDGPFATSQVPVYLLLDRMGTVVAVSYRIKTLEPALYRLLGGV